MVEPSSVDVRETSSWPTPMPEEQRSLCHQVLELFEEVHISYAVAGAFALQTHTGICRDTKDLDIFLTFDSVSDAVSRLERRGFSCEVCDPVWLYKVRRNGFFVDLITGMSNAVLTVDQSWIDRAQPALILGVHSRVLRPEELLASKLFVTRRERFDGADIAHIIFGTRGGLDWDRLLFLAGEHWEVLLWALLLFHYSYPAQTHYVPHRVWDLLIARLQDSLRHPDKNAKFRGSLIDEKMFAIDVNEWGLDNLFLDTRDRRMQTVARDSIRS
ncbi:MAG TPA: nucleotidyltransferase [Candidatus Sulfotelmatobacter sp.]|nr:nucleotidyltransferase [Candidatus Sulfotelmatobacter sp.]